ncbi:hypothetical protein SERLADRAFT_405139 [Serpula lacrymans var. lacrymans S7.9]|uniref:Uncharacterized protein n=1 Tax=Serpula lacrymans var. lacrymans (strain S7.9) TaxID=578457 RepID=F8NI51_SERL9|nr:uncharacterized protein SERLADRAFT_405139 [Serpula lacrymans var. lacrymans S7.9]EGO28948.1 hypothetical protein SERLADRAFT_405139 [Serpula lacrymans var. lacrymans S7.9]
MNSASQKQLSDIVKTIRSILFDATMEAVKNKPSDVEAKALFWQQESLLSQEFNKAKVLIPKVREMPLYNIFMEKVKYVWEMETKEDNAIDEEEENDMEEEVPPTAKYQSPGQIPQTPMTKIGPPRIRIPARKVLSKGKEREKEPKRIKPRYRQVEVVITKKRYTQNVPSPSKGKGKAKETPFKDTTTPKKKSKPIPYMSGHLCNVIRCAECLNNVKKEGPLCCVKEVDNPRGTKWARCYWRSLETRKALLKHQWTKDSWAPPSKEEIDRMDLQELLATQVKCTEMSLVVAETLWDLSKIRKKKLST